MSVTDIQSPKRRIIRSEKSYSSRHAFLGYGSGRNVSASVAKYYRDKLVYDVTYTIDSNGLRVSPPHNGIENRGCILFFGGSFTFGEGVRDKETLPYRVGIKTQGKYRIYNMAFHGYGPHQMLSSVEQGVISKTLKCRPQYAIYQGMLPHILRSAGLSSWDKHGPKYVLGEDGELSYKGGFDDGMSILRKSMMAELEKSIIVRRITMANYEELDNDQIRLFIEIVDKSREIIEGRYPGSEFHVLFWDEDGHMNFPIVLNGLKDKGIRVHLMSDIFTDVDEIGFGPHGLRMRLLETKSNTLKYVIGEYDGHPNSLANDLIAEYVVREIIRK